jgi:fructuronate reductase
LKLTEDSPAAQLSAKTGSSLLAYDRSTVTPGIVHLGVGAFCRAHTAMYLDGILPTDPTWGIIGASLRRPDTRDALAPQDFLYTLIERSGTGTKGRIIGSLLEVLDVAHEHGQLIAAMSDPRTRIISLTVTEKGYCHDPATGLLDANHPDIRHDLERPDLPISAPGLIVRAIESRRAAGLAPFTVLCCDNLPSNGETVSRIVGAFAALCGEDLARYLEGNIAFPSTMVDRIVPATTEGDRDLALKTTGLRDNWPVVTEPFTQWVVEDRFASERPPLERAGVQIVTDVRPHELMKLRMLNGSHSTLAYLGYLAGYEYVNTAIADHDLRTLIYDLMTEEVMGTLPDGLGDLQGYRDALLKRFANPALRHRTWQIAMDGSQKLPQRLLGTVRDRLASGRPIARLALGVAAWMRYVTGVDERGGRIDVRDPLSAKLRAISDAAEGSPEALVLGLLGISEVFGDDLPHNKLFSSTLCHHVTSLNQRGAIETAKFVHRNGRHCISVS